jgi:hypothetical protein
MQGTALMSKVASVFHSACVTMLLAALPAAQAAAVECADKVVSARGPGFTPSPETSMEAAKKEWLKKATKFFSDATMETAKDPKVMCASQGLYSNCTITAVPCGAVPVPPKPN